jgi:voltage-gated potassium channel
MEESPEGNGLAHLFNSFMATLIIVNVLAVTLETVASLVHHYHWLFSIIDLVSISIFTVEYFLRLWICTLNPHYSHPVTGRLRYMVSIYALIDLFSFLPFYLPLVIPFDLRFIRILRLFRLIRVMKLGRYSDAMRTFTVVVHKTKEELFLALSILLIVLVLSSTMMYYAENEAQPEKFDSIPAAMWWSVVTLATVGYGDIYPITPLGKLVGGVVVVTGIAIFALPAAILSAGFIEEIQEKRVVICPKCGYRIGGSANNNCIHEHNGKPADTGDDFGKPGS